jgi:hypothetical protein
MHSGCGRSAVLFSIVAAMGGLSAPAARAGEPVPSFERDVLPVLSAYGCNSGACHGKSRGQNGFHLSLRGFDPPADYAAIVQQARGRRVSPASPATSLLLRKATGEAPHGGGRRFDERDAAYETVRLWIAGGAPPPTVGDVRLLDITLSTTEHPPGRQLGVTAHYSDGSRRDVTRLCSFQSSDPMVGRVSDAGLVESGSLPGQATVMVRYMGQVATYPVLRPYAHRPNDDFYRRLPRRNFIDDLVWEQLRKLGLRPAGPADDATFHRRAWLDIVGRLPPADEVRRYLADPAADKREQLIDRLLARAEFADFWANKWADLLRPNPYRVGIKPTIVFDNWLREAFRSNLPYDRFASELITARGSAWRHGPAVLWRDRRTPEESAALVGQLFLGTRLECARCHDHPFERWQQDDFYGLAAFFAKVGRKGAGLLPAISGGEECIFTADEGELLDPRSGRPAVPRPLPGGSRVEVSSEPGADPREALAAWLVADDNPYFAPAAVNRIWAQMLGRGLVEPVDDLRTTNPASNPALLAALAEQFRREGYDVKRLIRTIANSYVYGLASLPGSGAAADSLNFSRHLRRPLRAEQLCDALTDLTGVAPKLAGMPADSRAMSIWTHRVASPLLDAFGRPDGNQDPPFIRTPGPTMLGILHLMNSPEIEAQIAHPSGSAAALAAGSLAPAELIEELYLRIYGRLPHRDEAKIALRSFAGTSRRQAIEDLMWSLVNTPEFFCED